MSTPISKKLKDIREAEGLNQREFADLCGLVYGTLRHYEAEIRSPGFEAIQKICAAFPQYTLYLMHEKMPLPRSEGQITPQEKIHLDLSSAEKQA